MVESVATADWRRLIVSWAYEHVVIRRAVLLGVLILWGCLLVMGLAIHPVTPRSQAYQSSMPFFTARGVGIDYYQFWVVGRAQEQLPPSNIYSMPHRQQMANLGREILRSNPSERLEASVKVRESFIQTFATPFLYAVINSLASGDYDRDYDHFMNFCLAASVFAILAMGWALGFSLAESVLFSAMLLLWCEPLASDLRVGNVNQLQLAGVSMYLLLRGRSQRLLADWCSGLILGALVAFKPTLGMVPMLLTVAWIIDRRWRTLLTQGLAALAGAAVAFLVGCRFLRSWSAWWDWKSAALDLAGEPGLSVMYGNYSLAQVIREATGGPAGKGVNLAPILLILPLLLAVVALLLTRKRWPGPLPAPADPQVWVEREFVVTALGCALSVIALKLVWLHYYVLLMPLLLYVLRPGGWVRSQTTGARAMLSPLAGLVLALLALAAILGKPIALALGLGPSSQVTVYICGAWGLTLMGVAGLWLPSVGMRQTRALGPAHVQTSPPGP